MPFLPLNQQCQSAEELRVLQVTNMFRKLFLILCRTNKFCEPCFWHWYLNYCWMVLGDEGVWELTGAQRWLIVDIAAAVADEKSSAASEPPAKRFKWVVLYIVESAVSDCDTKMLPFRTGLVAEHTWKKALSSGNWQTRVRLKTVIKMESGGIYAFSTWFLAHWPGQLRRQSSWEY